MTENNFTGYWEGEFIYGDQYPESKQGIAVSFEIKLADTNGEITGTCVDEETRRQFEYPATIQGFIDGNFISFIKKYPYQFAVDPGNPVSMKFFPDVESQEIHYSGLYENDMFTGDWEMVSTYKDPEGNILTDSGNGTWNMRKR